MSVYTISPSNDGARLYTMTDVYHLLIVIYISIEQ